MDFKRPHFDPPTQQPAACKLLADRRVVCHFPPPPLEPSSSYVYDEALILALNVALATQRPLLLVGEPGCGKTTLARNVAQVVDWAYLSHTVSSRTQAAELLWDVDVLQRLHAAHDPQRALLGEEHFVVPGPLWWALAPQSAARRMLTGASTPAQRDAALQAAQPDKAGAVLLIDEIDKAEPDVPNDLLEVLDTRRFAVRQERVEPERQRVLVVITSNLERELPGAFIRRCVVHRFPDAGVGWFAAIAQQRLPAIAAALAQQVEERLLEARQQARQQDRRVPGTAEYLDALQALQALGVVALPPKDAPPALLAASPWAQVERCIFGKQAAIDAG